MGVPTMLGHLDDPMEDWPNGPNGRMAECPAFCRILLFQKIFILHYFVVHPQLQNSHALSGIHTHTNGLGLQNKCNILEMETPQQCIDYQRKN